MARRLIATLLILSVVAGCARVSNSRLNPFNWFGRSQAVTAVPVTPDETGDPRPLIDQITTLEVERTPGGAIVRATGLPPTQGHWDGELLLVGDEDPVDGVLQYQFRIMPPPAPTRVSTPRSREVVVGLYLTRQALENVREIRVSAARNARAVRR
ncbi:hypothetical protein [Oceaniglobus roseus]|uniref:hypothetical protein n=1 Tax=Oceaniglobus roseus TaxID=1737570 RepID=UPI001561B456|nr:hypothetical protein [Kandeliimicrobium roseum]